MSRTETGQKSGVAAADLDQLLGRLPISPTGNFQQQPATVSNNRGLTPPLAR